MVFSQCSKSPSKTDSRITVKLSLRLEGGAPISSPNTDEYNPHLLLDTSNYLWLVFGSDRVCTGAVMCTSGNHHIFITKSLTPYDGGSLPFFNEPVVLSIGSPGWPGTANKVKFAATMNSNTITICAKTNTTLQCASNVPENGAITPGIIANTTYQNSSPIGVDATGQKLIVLDLSNQAYEIGISTGNTALPALDSATSAVGVREENSGYSDGYFVDGQFGTTASTKDAMVGPLATLEVALASSGLQLTTINSFFSSSAEDDLVLFSAKDELSDDMYVVTSHTAEQLWNTTGFFGPGPGGAAGSIAIDLSSGPVGSLLTITGTDFDLSDVSSVTVNGTPAIILSSNATTAQVMVMPGSTTGIVTVTAGAGTHVAPFIVSSNSPIANQQGAKLVGTPSAANANQERCALSADGNTAIIGGLRDATNTGAAWVFTRSGTTWSQQAKLVGTGANGFAEQGQSVAISADGNTAVVSGHCDNTCRGALWVYTRSGTTWAQQGAKLVAAGPPDAYTFMGWQIALSADGNTVIAGGYGDASNNGAAWVFTRSSGSWSEQAKLVGTGNTGAAVQGWSVAISADGNTALVGGKNDNSNAGAAWLFTRSGAVWSQQGAKLVGTGATGTAEQGASVALSADGNTALIGGPADSSYMGAVWVFTRSGTSWSAQGGKITSTGNIGNAEFGYSLALSADGNSGVIGGYRDNSNQGAAWMFTRSGATWTQGAKLIGSGAAVTAPHQASTVAISANGNTVISGGYNDNSGVGAAWIFVP